MKIARCDDVWRYQPSVQYDRLIWLQSAQCIGKSKCAAPTVAVISGRRSQNPRKARGTHRHFQILERQVRREGNTHVNRFHHCAIWCDTFTVRHRVFKTGLTH
jgi:hypothetical protein